MEFGPGQVFDPGLHTEVLVPDDALKEGVDEPHHHGSGQQLGPELGPLGNAARDDGRNGGRKGEQEEELHQVVAVFGCQLFGSNEKVRAIGHAVADHEIHDGGHGKVHQNFHQRVDLVLFADRAQLQKSKACVHGQHHDAAQQNEQGVRALLQCFHVNLVLRMIVFGAFGMDLPKKHLK